jgi:hypothetical protein
MVTTITPFGSSVVFGTSVVAAGALSAGAGASGFVSVAVAVSEIKP